MMAMYPNPPKSSFLKNPVLLYNNGLNWKVYPMKYIQDKLIINDKYYEKDTEIDITIYSCPSTLFSCILFGFFNRGDGCEIIDENGNISDPIKMVDNQRKKEVRLLTLKTAMKLHPDCVFFDEEYNNEFEGKISYLIEYKSSKTFAFKYTLLIPKFNSLDVIENGFNDYYQKMKIKMKQKGAIIYPCDINYAKLHFKNLVIIKL